MNYTINELMNLDRSKLVEISWNTQLELKKAREKVKLPRNVAEAIKVCESAGISKFGIVTLMERVSSLFRDYSKPVRDALVVIRDFAWRDVGGGDRFLAALVYGYEIEETPENHLEDDLVKMISTWLIEEIRNPRDDNRILARRILERIEQENKQSG